MISMYSGTIGSGKSYHALETITDHLDKGGHVIANFPLNFQHAKRGREWQERFMYVDDRYFMGVKGIRLLLDISRRQGWDEDEREGICLVVIDEATNFFAREDNNKPEQKLWRSFFTQTRKLGYDFILIVQDDMSINKTISKCIEYDVKHRKANNIFPFSLLNMFKITIFFYNTYWKQQRLRLRSDSTMFVKRLSKMYQSKRMFANLDEQLDKFINDLSGAEDEALPETEFGNCSVEDVIYIDSVIPNASSSEDGAQDAANGWGPGGAGPGGSDEHRTEAV